MKLNKERNKLFSYLNGILDVSQKKFSMNNKVDGERRSWARVSIQAINSYGKLLESAQLDQLMKEIEQIKKHIGLKK